jgi:hypothetical protein
VRCGCESEFEPAPRVSGSHIGRDLLPFPHPATSRSSSTTVSRARWPSSLSISGPVFTIFSLSLVSSSHLSSSTSLSIQSSPSSYPYSRFVSCSELHSSLNIIHISLIHLCPSWLLLRHSLTSTLLRAVKTSSIALFLPALTPRVTLTPVWTFTIPFTTTPIPTLHYLHLIR